VTESSDAGASPLDRGLAVDGHLDHVTLEHTPTGERRTVDCSGLFCFIGAEPATAWLSGVLELDAKGFILTDRFPTGRDHEQPAVRDARPLPVRNVGAGGIRRR
jgi:hypothetical protein